MANKMLPEPEKILSLIKDGYKVKEIAMKYEVTEMTVRNYLNKKGISSKITPDRETIAHLYDTIGMSVLKISEKYNRSPETIKKWILASGLNLRENKYAPVDNKKRKEAEEKRKSADYMSNEDIKLLDARYKKDIVCNYKVGDPIEIYGEVRTVIQVTKELIVTKGIRIESFRIYDL